ncbi:hypothetical protein F511_20329 [Dorcoceras hygrometricum]|uniref:Uncharacterized protein n=1 Tax=Dorcoceras hygrometricum TaxID=472368 RepID=A0A2Z7D8U2_9LAMI|nr:hypothetical protein F511_20329 [Dorcoceras hygrometricum]
MDFGALHLHHLNLVSLKTQHALSANNKVVENQLLVENQQVVEKSAFGSVNSAFGWSNQLLHSHPAPEHSTVRSTVSSQQHSQQSAGKGSNQLQETVKPAEGKGSKPAAGKWSNQLQETVKPAAGKGSNQL